MWLILHERHDLDAVWAARKLERQQGLRPLELVTAHDLAAARRWEQRLGRGAAASVLELGDGRTIDSATVSGAVNRLLAVPPEAVERAAPADRDYALQELYALFTSWLEALPGPVLNRPSPQALAGPWLSPSEWIALAAHAGLDAPTFSRSSAGRARLDLPDGSSRSLLVVGRRGLGPPAPARARVGAGRLARLAGASLLEVRFRVDGGGRWVFAGADTRPPLRRYGERGIDLLARALQDGRR